MGTQNTFNPEDFLQKKDLESLQRYWETTEDGQDYDIGKEAVSRLAELGCLERAGSTTRYSITSFGEYVLGYSKIELPLKTVADYPSPHPVRNS